MSTEVMSLRRTRNKLDRKQARELENWVEANHERLASGELQRDVIVALASTGCGCPVSFASIRTAAEIVGVQLKVKRTRKKTRAFARVGGGRHLSPSWSAIVGIFDVVNNIAGQLGVKVPGELSDAVDYMRRNNFTKDLSGSPEKN